MTKGKVAAALAWLGKLGLGENVADAREPMRRADLFMSVASAPLGPIPD